jgi:hypothetical protein
VLIGTDKHLENEERDQQAIGAMSTEALTTSEIEGENLDRASMQSPNRKQLGLETDTHRVWRWARVANSSVGDCPGSNVIFPPGLNIIISVFCEAYEEMSSAKERGLSNRTLMSP